MTKLQKEKLEKAKREALKNPPKELRAIIIDTKKSSNKKSSHQILMEMRYGHCWGIVKHCILQDSSFLIATLDKSDEFHQDAILIFKKLIENKDKIKIVIPSLVFYETIVTLIKRGGIPTKVIEKKLWNFLYSSMILNISLIETNAFKMCRQLINHDLSLLKTPDFIVINTGMEFEAQILTFDKQMRKRVGQIYSEIYYCSALGNMEDETPRFLNDLNKKLGKDEINIDDIPFWFYTSSI